MIPIRSLLSPLICPGPVAALAYARQHFGRFQQRFMPSIQRLMGCLVYFGKPLAETKYRDLLSPTAWEDISVDFMKQVPLRGTWKKWV